MWCWHYVIPPDSLISFDASKTAIIHKYYSIIAILKKKNAVSYLFVMRRILPSTISIQSSKKIPSLFQTRNSRFLISAASKNIRPWRGAPEKSAIFKNLKQGRSGKRGMI